MKEKFIDHRFNERGLALIAKASAILTEYSGQGYRLSLRQLYYQLVARGEIPNSVRSYKNVGGLISDARLAGLLDWNGIEDRNREHELPSHWRDPGQILEAAAASYHIDFWQDQPCWVEVMVEKDALSGILGPVCSRLDIGFMANKGYSSSSALYEASKRIRKAARDGKEIHVLYLGDHDPSGIDMTRDIRDRLTLFTREEIPFTLTRLALNYDQVEQWNPPPNPAKETDSRYETYAQEFGESSWELDAVEPATLASLVEDFVNSKTDKRRWAAARYREAKGRETLLEVAKTLKGDGG